MQVVSRADAKLAELKRFFTGVQCKHGHASERFTSDGKCIACVYARNTSYSQEKFSLIAANKKIYRAKNSERISLYMADWRQNNSEKIAVDKKLFYQENAEKINEKSRQLYLLNAESNRAYAKAYRAKNYLSCIQKARLFYAKNSESLNKKKSEYTKANRGLHNALSAKRKLRQKNATPAWADYKEIKAIYQKAARLGMDVDHIIPIQGSLVSGLHVHSNLQLLSRHENRRKSNNFDPMSHVEPMNLHAK